MAQSCIQPSSMGGGSAFSLSFSTGYGGSPSSATIRYATDKESFNAVNLSLKRPLTVGVSGKTRPMYPVKYSIDQSVGSNILTVTFQDAVILQMQRKFVILRDPNVNIPGGGCVAVLGEIFHKPPGAPNRVDGSVLRPGRAPKIKTGDTEKKLGTEYVFYRMRALASVAAPYCSPAVLKMIRGYAGISNKTGNLLSIIQSIAGETGTELYANDDGKLDVVSGSNPKVNVGDGCEIVSIKTAQDITCTEDQGGYAIYKHEDTYRKDFKQRYKLLDVLSLVMPNCKGELIPLKTKGMSAEDAKQLERLMKIAWLGPTWENWNGIEPYVFLKRAVASMKCGQDISVYYLGQQSDSDHGKNKVKESVSNVKRRCVKVGSIPTTREGGEPSKTIDRLFECLNPCVLNVDAVDPKIKEEIVHNYKNSNPGATNPKIVEAVNEGDKLKIMMVNKKVNLICQDGSLSESSEDVEENDDPLAFVKGSKASVFKTLSELAQTIGRYWIMSGGGGGGGAGLLTQREHDAREYKLEGEDGIYWYHPDASVKDTCFGTIYDSIFSVYKNDNFGEDAKDLSISQFLQLAAKIRIEREDVGGGDPIGDAFGNAKGMGGDELAAANAAAQEKCKKEEPKGIVILDKKARGIALPTQDKNLQLIANGIEVHEDVGASDVVKTLMRQVSVVSLINPCGGGAACIDASLDEYQPHADFTIDVDNEGKTVQLEYIAPEPREHFDAFASFPDCNEVYSASINYADISGQVLWRDADCNGTIKPWEEDFREDAQVSNALRQKVWGMRRSQKKPCLSTTISTCGSSPASMPSGGATQDFSVDYGDDGSITTNFTVSGTESSIANKSLSKHNFNTAAGNQPRTGDQQGQGPAPDPTRSLRNPRTA